jgi:hypothetical protein
MPNQLGVLEFMHFPALDLTQTTCGRGFLRLKVSMDASYGSGGLMSATKDVDTIPQHLRLEFRVTGPIGVTLPALGASFSLCPIRATPGCTMADVFALSSAGVLSVKPGTKVDAMVCPDMGVTLSAATDCGTAT